MTSSRAARLRLVAVASRQAGYVTARQAVDAGYSHQAQWYHRDRGHWVPVRRGIVRLADHPASPRERFVVACLVAGPTAVVHRFSALEVHGIRRPGPVDVQVSTTNVPDGDRQDGGGFAVTTPLRSLRDVDAARRPEGPRWLERAVRLGLVSPEDAARLRQP